MKRQWIWRGLIYLVGLTILAVGTTFSTKTGLGVSCVTSAPYAISQVLGWNLSTMVFLIYAAMIVAQFIIKGKNRAWRDLLQFPVSIVFSALLEWSGSLIAVHFEHLWQNLLLMAAGVALVGVGISMMVGMKIVPNPPDGLAHTVSEATGKDMGLIKNILDTTCVVIAVTADLLGSGKITTVGLGTVYSMIFIGRTIAVFNRFFKVKMLRLAGLETAQ